MKIDTLRSGMTYVGFSCLMTTEEWSQYCKWTLKVPHMGWNNLSHCTSDPLFDGIDENQSFYFVHSYVIQPTDASVILATADYGISVPAAVRKGSLVAVQFHPEKSGEPGLRLLKNFCCGGEE